MRTAPPLRPRAAPGHRGLRRLLPFLFALIAPAAAPPLAAQSTEGAPPGAAQAPPSARPADAPAPGSPAPLGPLAGEDGAPLQRITLTPAAEPADLVPRGAVRTGLWLGYSNVFERDSTAQRVLFVDMERLITSATVRWGVAERVEVGGRLTFESTGRGSLDGIVRWWHDVIGVGNATRDEFPEGGYAYRLVDEDGGPLLDVPSSALSLEDVRFFVKWRVASLAEDRGTLALRGTVRLPTRFGVVGREGTDFALSALGRFSHGRWHLHAMAGTATLRASGPLAPELRDHTHHFLLGVERSLGSRWAAVAQYAVGTPVLNPVDRRRLDAASANLVLGLVARIADDWRLDVSFQEDVPPETPAVDFTLGLSLARTW